MPTIFDLLYREYCRARLAEMRKQLLIPVVGDEIPEADVDGSNRGGHGNWDSGCGDGSRDKKGLTSHSRHS